MSKDICILVVDDFSTMRRLIRRILRDLGLENVVEADNGNNAWKVLNEHRVDLIICDWNMPYMTGVDLLEKVRGDEKFSDLPFVMVTAEGKKNFILEATKKGVTNYITKPFSAQDLSGKLKGMLRNWG
ncbi:response regulator [Desulfonema ishimotonii]|uniref:Response regulator n=1 Tax=Desulfonema ishimotonii TaxID=45657 RepID=A0A401FSY2_9BACT|nr:response regulator [Desulfonema ishimotonii]GBC60050.1 response regulator [Desulfonema ishimotonii]